MSNEEVCREMLRKDPRDYVALGDLYEILKDRGETVERDQVLDRLIELDDHGSYCQERLVQRIQAGDFDGAFADGQKVAERTQHLNAVTHVFLNCHDDSKTLELAEWFLRRDPRCSRAYLERGRVKAGSGDPLAARDDYGRAIDSDLKNEVAYALRGTLSLKEGRIVDALGDFSRAIDLYPNYDWVYVARAEARVLVGDRPGAMQDLEQALARFKPGSEEHQEATAFLSELRAGRPGPRPYSGPAKAS